MRDAELRPHRERAGKRIGRLIADLDTAIANASSGDGDLGDIAKLGHDVRLFRHTDLPFFAHYGADERYLTLLAAQISDEAGCPIPTPIVGTFSNRGYWTVPELRCLCVPAGEGSQLLTLPDLVHELAHVLQAEQGEPLVATFIQTVLAPYTGSLDDQKLGRRLHAQYTAWHTEFVADTFAAYVCGPAYGWQHIRLGAHSGALAAPRSWAPAEPSTGLPMSSHPSDAARMSVIVKALRSTGQDDGAKRLEAEWGVMTAGAGPRPETYDVTYAEELLSPMVDTVLGWCESNGIVQFADARDDAVVRHVASAWECQLSDPDAFAAEEDARVAALRRLVAQHN